MKYIEILRKLYRGRKKITTSPVIALTDALSTKVLHNLNSKGIHIEPDFMTPQEVTAIRASIDETLGRVTDEQWQHVRSGVSLKENRFGVSIGDAWNLWIDREGSDRRISHAEHMHPLIHDFAHNERFRQIGSTYLDKDIVLKFCMVNRTTYAPTNLGSGGGWHRDNNYKRGFKALLYLSDSDEDNGCFQYLERSASIFHHLLKTPFPDKYQFTHEEVLRMVDSDEHKITSAVAKAGTLVMFDTNGVHRGKPLAPGGSRYAMTNYYID
jgi:hypothetical protein